MDEKTKLQSWYLRRGEPKPVETRHFATLDELIQHTKEISKEIEQVRENNKRCLQLYKDDYYKWTEAIYSTDDAEELKRLNPVLTSHILAMKGFMDREHNSETKEEYQKILDRYNELKDALNERLAFLPNNRESESITFEYDHAKILEVYKFCTKHIFAEDEVEFHQFTTSVAKANFREIFDKTDTKKSKLLYIICVLADILDNGDWYKRAAKSVGKTPSRCSGVNVNERWKIKADKLKEPTNALK